jgi:hypothetical protein
MTQSKELSAKYEALNLVIKIEISSAPEALRYPRSAQRPCCSFRSSSRSSYRTSCWCCWGWLPPRRRSGGKDRRHHCCKTWCRSPSRQRPAQGVLLDVARIATLPAQRHAVSQRDWVVWRRRGAFGTLTASQAAWTAATSLENSPNIISAIWRQRHRSRCSARSPKIFRVDVYRHKPGAGRPC